MNEDNKNMGVIIKDACGRKCWSEVTGSDWTMTDEEVKEMFAKQTKLTVYEVVDVFAMNEMVWR